MSILFGSSIVCVCVWVMGDVYVCLTEDKCVCFVVAFFLILEYYLDMMHCHL